ncbi:MAG: MBL fold metallo-hydrolase [Acidobacteriota bacterium]
MKPTAVIMCALFALPVACLTAREDKAVGDVPRVTFVANDGFLLENGGAKVLVDAAFSSPSGRPSQEVLDDISFARGPFADIDLMLITHHHRDHVDPKVVAAHLQNNAHCRLIANTRTVDLLRKEDGFDRIRDRVHEVNLEPGTNRRMTVNGIDVGVLALIHSGQPRDGRIVPAEPMGHLAFVVDLAGAGFLHVGDAWLGDAVNKATLSAYPFDEAPVQFLFLNFFCRTPAERELIARTIKPSRIIAMHIAPADLAKELKEIHAAYPWAIVFRDSMEQRFFPNEIDFHNLTGDYLGQPPPGATPQVFSRGIVSTDLQEHGAPSFSPDGNEVFWLSNRKPGPDNESWIGAAVTMRREKGRWSAPFVPGFAQMFDAFSADGRRGYFHAPRPGAAQQPGPNTDLWFAEKQGDHWSEPKCLNLIARYPELRFAYSPTISRNGTLYFTAYAPGPLNDYGLYRSELVNGEYGKPELLPRNINLSPFLNWTPFIAPDESYLLFSSNRSTQPGDVGDLYISRRRADGSWTDPVSLGEPVNTDRQERFPKLSNDGKYLFFSRQTPDHDEDVFWVDAAAVPALRP